MVYFFELINTLTGGGKALFVIFLVLLLIFAVGFLVGIAKRHLLKKAKSKKQISNIKIFTRVTNIFFIVLIMFVAFFSYSGSWTGLGIFAGLLTAGLGFALQRPITGIAAWFMVVLKRPFSIGDRIIIGNVKGEVYDITLTHTYLDEIGGAIDTEDYSGRNIMVPNYLLFEQNIINYTLMDDYVLGEVLVDVTYESDLEKAIKIAYDSAIKFVEDFSKSAKKDPKVRVKMGPSSVTLKVRFFAPIKLMSETKSNINMEIFSRIREEKEVEIAYPHTEIVFKNKNLFKK